MNHLNYFSPMEVFIIQLKLAFVIALVISFPYCVWQIWKFLLPALYPSERKALKWWVLSSYFLFVLGGIFCVGFILPILMNFFVGFSSSELRPVIGFSSFLWLTGWLTFAFGIMFQFPIAVMLAVKIQPCKIFFFKIKRPYIIVIILIFATNTHTARRIKPAFTCNSNVLII
ncbi:MAG: twin-arginine translocase subunit TatC [Endomicrobium sp.]|nr:twin-arginine translocase subunit TatC [Endomicrobium sp.]